MRLGDYASGLRYVRWFDKNFADDIGYPDFLFEWIILLFQNGRLPEAGQKAVQTYCANTYLFDKFFGRPLVPIAKWEGSNLEMPYQAALLPYSSRQPELTGFAQWLSQLVSTAKFRDFSARFLGLGQALQTAADYETRRALLDARRALETTF